MIGTWVKTIRRALGWGERVLQEYDDRLNGVEEAKEYAEALINERDAWAGEMEMGSVDSTDRDEVAAEVVARTMYTSLDGVEEEEQVGTYWDDRPKYDFVEKPVVTFDDDERELVIYDGEVEVRGDDDESDSVDEEQSNLADWNGDRR